VQFLIVISENKKKREALSVKLTKGAPPTTSTKRDNEEPVPSSTVDRHHDKAHAKPRIEHSVSSSLPLLPRISDIQSEHPLTNGGDTITATASSAESKQPSMPTSTLSVSQLNITRARSVTQPKPVLPSVLKVSFSF